jgi:hypothetical protein
METQPLEPDADGVSSDFHGKIAPKKQKREFRRRANSLLS